jgi:putative ABC transport system ATP-binding protein
MINLENIHKSYRTGQNALHVLKGVSLRIGEGEFVSIMGSSGSGKSTLLNIIGLLDNFDEGLYELDNRVMKNLSEKRAARYRNQFLGFVFQSFNLIPYKTALENVALPLYYQKISRRKRNDKAMEYLEKVGLGPWAEHVPSELSGGQKQRVAIARAIITEPKVLLADEPTGALDSSTSNEVMDVFKNINDLGMTIVVVTHENDIAAMTKRIVRFKDGVVEKDEQVKSAVIS